MANDSIKLEQSWKSRLGDEFDKDYMVELRQFLNDEKSAGKQIYPKGGQYFYALDQTPYDKARVVILGQDPYHGPGQAHGLCFSVAPGVRLPPSLQNVFKEIRQQLGIEFNGNGCLQHWAEQGVLLLNAVLTVEQGQAASHQGKGWEAFTDRVIELLNERDEPLVFMLWGSHAQKKGKHIDRDKHLVLTSPHPSPLSAHRGFFGNQHFVKANDFLQETDQSPIDWSVPAA
ncbi:MAG: uracil-DNA glycosylase [Gammaproteobacteria bacterium]|nr:uracil-DNA glycosylase [Gammaproteobacteria bacterium]